MRIFAENELRQYLNNLLARTQQIIHSEDKNRILSINETEYIDNIISSYTLEPITFQREQLKVSDREEYVTVGGHAFTYGLTRTDKTKRQIFVYHLPYSGTIELLSLTPSSRIIWSIDIEVHQQEITFEIVNWSENIEEIKREANQIIDKIITQAQNSTNEINQYNSQLKQKIHKVFTERKQKLLEQSNILENLGVPIKDKGEIPESISTLPEKKEETITKTFNKRNKTTSTPNISSNVEWDVFICHASEDKEEFVRPLANALDSKGLKVWYDEFTLKLGDSLRRSIDRGLNNSKYGIVVLSKSFFIKEWPQKELDGLTSLEENNRKVILPIWHKITKKEVVKYSPILADKLAVESSNGLDNVIESIIDVINN